MPIEHEQFGEVIDQPELVVNQLPSQTELNELFQLPEEQRRAAVIELAHRVQDTVVALWPRLPGSFIEKARAKFHDRDARDERRRQGDSTVDAEPFEPITPLENVVNSTDTFNDNLQETADGKPLYPRGPDRRHGIYFDPANFDFDDELEYQKELTWYEGSMQHHLDFKQHYPNSDFPEPEAPQRFHYDAQELFHYVPVLAEVLVEEIEVIAAAEHIALAAGSSPQAASDEAQQLVQLYRDARRMTEPSVTVPYFTELPGWAQSHAYLRDAQLLAAELDRLIPEVRANFGRQGEEAHNLLIREPKRARLLLQGKGARSGSPAAFLPGSAGKIATASARAIERRLVEDPAESVSYDEHYRQQYARAHQLWRAVADAAELCLEVVEGDSGPSSATDQLMKLRQHLTATKDRR